MRSYRAGGHAARSIGVVMEGFKEFLGKTLDAAIAEACSYYNASREKLEIEIIQDAKTGIFGIVGARKAKVRARRAALREAVENALGRGSRSPAAPDVTVADSEKSGDGALPAEQATRPVREGRTARNAPASDGGTGRRSRGREEERQAREGEARESRRNDDRGQKPPRKAIAAREEALLPAPAAPEISASDAVQPDEKDGSVPGGSGTRRATSENSPRNDRCRGGDRTAGRERRRPTTDDDMDEVDESLPRRALEELDQDRLRDLARQCISQLIRPMVNQPVDEPDVEIVDGRVRVAVDCGEDSGLLIGREGQTLAALQYLASRIVSRGMDAAVRVQLDAGRYRQRQEEKLRDMALALAAKVRQTGRSYSTRPLSSYHRRIIHLCLQDMDDVLTRSTGDGPLKRVVILRRRPEKGDRQVERENRRRSQTDSASASNSPCTTPASLETAVSAAADVTTGMPGDTAAAVLPAENAPAAQTVPLTEADATSPSPSESAQDRA